MCIASVFSANFVKAPFSFTSSCNALVSSNVTAAKSKLNKLKRSALVSLLALSCSFLVACSSMADSIADKPEVAVTSVGVKEVSFSGVTLDVAIKVDNPNSFAFEVDGVDYLLKVNGNKFLQGEYKETTKIPANGSAEIRVPISVKLSDVTGLFDSMDRISEVGYMLETMTYVDLPGFGSFEVPSNHDGTLKLSDFFRIGL